MNECKKVCNKKRRSCSRPQADNIKKAAAEQAKQHAEEEELQQTLAWKMAKQQARQMEAQHQQAFASASNTAHAPQV